MKPDRIRMELEKMANQNFGKAMRLMYEYGFLQKILPCVSNLEGVEQNSHHQEGDVLEHTFLVCENVPEGSDFTVYMAALLHDTGKLATQKVSGNGYSFHGHEYVSGEIAKNVCNFLKFSNEEKDEIVYLVQNHMRVKRIDEMKRSKKVEIFESPYFLNLLTLTEADEMGRLPNGNNHEIIAGEYIAYLQKRKDSPAKGIDIKSELGISGDVLMGVLGVGPGPVVGRILGALNEAYQDDPTLTREDLLLMAQELFTNS